MEGRGIRRSPGINLDEDIQEQINSYQERVNSNKPEEAKRTNHQSDSLLSCTNNDSVRVKYKKTN